MTSKETIESLKKSLATSTALVTRLEKDLEEQTHINQYNASQVNKLNQQLHHTNDSFHLMTASPLPHNIINNTSSINTGINTGSNIVTNSNITNTNLTSGIATTTPLKTVNNNLLPQTLLTTSVSEPVITHDNTATTINAAATSNSSMINIIQGQRDRYKQKLVQASIIRSIMHILLLLLLLLVVVVV